MLRENKPLLIVVLLALILLSFLIPVTSLPIVLGQPNPTLPTIPPPATNTPTSGGGGGGGNPVNPPPTSPPSATNTPEPTATSTLIPVTIAPTPEGGFLPTAVSCSNNPTIQAINPTNVRPGPGVEYGPPIAQLVFLEVRPIVARAEFVPWWLIVLDNGATGWVADDVVNVSGNIAVVPIANAPDLDGATPAPGVSWQPTPNPICPTLTPTVTATPSPETTATMTPGPTETAVTTTTTATTENIGPSSPTPTLISGELTGAQSGGPSNQTAAADVSSGTSTEGTSGSNGTNNNNGEAVAAAPADANQSSNATAIEGNAATAVPNAAPLAADAAAGSATTPILPIAAGIFILGGIGLFIWRRLNPTDAGRA